MTRLDSACMACDREQVRLGHAVTFFIWPDVDRFVEYRLAQLEAQAHGRGVWAGGAAPRELPFEHRQRGEPLHVQNRRQLDQNALKPVGDYFTRRYVDSSSYRLVHVNNRVFFWNEADAARAGFRPCPRSPRRTDGQYLPSCFAAGS